MRASPASLAFICGAALLLAIAPAFAGSYVRYLIVIWLIYSISAVGLNLPIGLGRLYSLGHGGFMLVGAYATAVVTTQWNWPAPVALVFAIMLAIATGILVGLPALRLRQFSLAIVTFAFGYTLFHLVKSFNVFGGPQGIFMPQLWLSSAFSGLPVYYLTLALALASVLAARSIASSKTGRALRMIGENETAAASLGISLTYYKLVAFIFASVLGAVSGFLHAVATGYVAPETYSAELSITMFAAVMIGGKGTLIGPFLGAGFIVAVPEFAQASQGLAEILYALLFLGIVTLSPGGLAGASDMLRARMRGTHAIPDKKAAAR
ncbi:MAG TPA: branched-chain amino acid ABC transporter permease [Rhizobiaceae bacterium]|nr:branched-chain amino acid ABC transporter permease [Rhizobiaceae bacterium]